MMATRLSLREKRLIQAAIVLAILVLLYLLLRGGSEPVRVVAREPAAAPAPPPAAPPIAAAPALAPALPADHSGLRLHGLLATGAILGFANGGQRLVSIGREALPGLILRRIEQGAAVFESGGGEVRLGFDGATQGPAQAATAPAAPPAAASLREENLRYRLGLAPRRAGGRVTGFTMRPGAELPALARAGIRPGDVIVAVNGATFDEERMLELAWQIANSARMDFEVERGGRRIRLSLPNVTPQ
jgi:type II secretion system protein C